MRLHNIARIIKELLRMKVWSGMRTLSKRLALNLTAWLERYSPFLQRVEKRNPYEEMQEAQGGIRYVKEEGLSEVEKGGYHEGIKYLRGEVRPVVVDKGEGANIKEDIALLVNEVKIERKEAEMIPANKVEMRLCWRCGLKETGKRIIGKDGIARPICSICFLADARINHGITLGYEGLKPVWEKAEVAMKLYGGKPEPIEEEVKAYEKSLPRKRGKRGKARK